MALGLFLFRAAPGVTFEDSGELAAAAATWGVPHPPGYPLEMLLGRLWMFLLAPFELEPARALNLLSAVCAAGAAALLARLLVLLGAGLGAAFSAGVLLILAPTFASQAVVTEVYAPAALVLMGLALVSLRARRPAVPGMLLLGLACCAHQAAIFWAPLPLLGILRSKRSGEETRSPGRLALVAAAAFGAGLLPYLYVPLAAARDPLVNWGEASGPAALFDHLLRLQYTTGLDRDWPVQLEFLAEQLAGQWPLALGLALIGLAVYRDRVPGGALRPLLLCLALGSVGMVLAVNYPLAEPAARARLAGSYTHLILLSSAVAGLGLAALEAGLRARLPRAPVAWLLPPAVLALALALGPRTPLGPGDRRGDDAAERYAQAVLQECPPDAILVLSKVGLTDILHFPLLYAQVVHRARPDVLIVDRGMLPLDWYRRQLARRHPQLAPGLELYDRGRAAYPAFERDPPGRRRLTIPVLQTLFDGPRPAVLVGSRPGPNLLGDRRALPGIELWHIRAEGSARPPFEIPTGGPSATYLSPTDRDPFTAELRNLARERDLARAGQLENRGHPQPAQILRTHWRDD